MFSLSGLTHHPDLTSVSDCPETEFECGISKKEYKSLDFIVPFDIAIATPESSKI